MVLLSVEKISKSFADKLLFREISFGIEEGQKVALVAKNGTGKTTLLHLITGKESPDAGIISVRKETKIGYLAQEPQLPENKTIKEAFLEIPVPALQALAAYENLLEKHADDAEMEAVLAQMERLQAWDYDTRMKQILGKLAIHDLTQTIANLSGGQKKRIALAKALLEEPDFLILDEPTNHLDIEMTEWLEGYLSSSALTLLMVTHDRYFLENVCNEIIELENGEIYQHKGNYEYYLEQKAARREREEKELDKAKNLFRKELEWIRKQPKARTTKSKARIDAFEELAEKASKRMEEKKVQLEMNLTRIGTKVLELHNISKTLGNKLLFKNFTYKFTREDRIGLVGKNGAGKSTLLKIMLGQMEPDTGKVVLGETVVPGYYKQEGLQLSEDKRIIEVITDIAEFLPLKQGKKMTAAQLLERFLFPREMHYNLVSKLSGGEKRRLFLLTILMKNPNFLILDEPTNDLDIETLTVLEDFLADFPGCLLIVTHDRYFIDRLVDHLFVIESDQSIRDFPGNYSDYLIWKEMESKKVKEVQKTKNIEQNTPVKEKTKKLSYKEQKELENIEIEMEKMEQEKKILIEKMNQGLEFDEVDKVSKRYQEIENWIDEKTLRWLELSELS
jgi:ATP-binding cassette subfamily F protein uup